MKSEKQLTIIVKVLILMFTGFLATPLGLGFSFTFLELSLSKVDVFLTKILLVDETTVIYMYLAISV